MKKLFIGYCAVLMLGFCAPAFGAISFTSVVTCSQTATTTTTCVAASAMTVSTGDVIVLHPHSLLTGQTYSISDTCNQNWVRQSSAHVSATGAGTLDTWMVIGAVAGSCTITVTRSPGTTRFQWYASNYAGVSSVGNTNTTSGGATSTSASLSITTQDNNNFVETAFALGKNETVTTTTGTQRSVNQDGIAETIAAYDNTAATPSSVTNAITFGATAFAAVGVELRAGLTGRTALLSDESMDVLMAGSNSGTYTLPNTLLSPAWCDWLMPTGTAPTYTIGIQSPSTLNGQSSNIVMPTFQMSRICQDSSSNFWMNPPIVGGTGATVASTATATTVNAPVVPSTWIVQRTACANVTNCTQIHGDGKYVIDATSNSTTTITCPNNDCNFTSADVGKVVWATTQGTGAGVGFLTFTTYVCPVTTIQTINSAQSITVGTTCTASGTANTALYWATDDGTALAALDSTIGCSVVTLPDTGVGGQYILTSQPFLVNAPSASQCSQQITTSTGSPGPALVGTGYGASQTILMVSPSFNWANCKAIAGASKSVCFGGTARTLANLQFWGSGLTSASNSTGCSGAASKILVSASPISSTMYGVDAAGVCPGAASMIGVELNSYDENFDLGGVQEVGTTACNAHNAKSLVLRESDCHNIKVASGIGLNVESGAQVLDLGSYPMSVVTVSGQYTTRGTHIVSPLAATVPLAITGTGLWISYGDYVGVDTAGGFANPTTAVTVASGGQVQMSSTAVKATTHSITNSGLVVSLGGNNLQALPGGTGTWQGANVLVGSCRGTATSSATLGLYGFGQTATTACTSTVTNLGQVVSAVPLSGSVFMLNVTAGTACLSGNTCVFTVLKNGAATTITCSMTAGASSCQDTTHFDTPAAGDTYSVQFTTGATETLANVTATLLAW